MYQERPLSTLPDRDALIDELLGPASRVARSMERIDPVERDQLLARARVDARGADALAIGRATDTGFEALGLFALTPLTGHALARRLGRAVGGACRNAYPAPFGLAHPIALRPGAPVDAYAAVVRHVAHRALGRLYGAVFFSVLDRGTAGVYRRFGLEFPSELADLGPAIAVLEPGRPASLTALRALDRAA